jgi:beta-fructofuranosidase
MLYRPAHERLWDAFLMREEGWFELFHLRDGVSLGRARSRDLVRWQRRPPIDLRGEPGMWNESGAPWTGCVVRREGRYFLFAGGPGPDRIPAYGLLVSDDLEHWAIHRRDPVLVPTPPHYQRRPSDLHPMHAAWRDPCVIRDEAGVYHAFLCARRPDWSADDTGAVIAHARSTDLVDWEYLPPIAAVGDRVLFAEVPDIFRLGDWWYALFLDHGWGGARVNTPTRTDAGGTFYLKARRLEGPYHWPDDPLLIGCGDDHVGPWAARTIEVDGERWLYCHENHDGGSTAFTTPKRIVQAADGDLSLEYLPILDRLAEPRIEPPALPGHRQHPQDRGRWRTDGGAIVGSAAAVGTAASLESRATHLIARCRIRSTSAARAGLAIRVGGEAGTDLFEQTRTGLTVWLDYERRRLLVEPNVWVPGFGWGRHIGQQTGWSEPRGPRQQVACPLHRDRPADLRVVARDDFVEVYLDDRWMLTTHHPAASAGDQIELIVERGEAAFKRLTLHALPPLDSTEPPEADADA